MMPGDIYFALAENSPVATLAYDLASNKVSYANPAFYRLINSDNGTVSVEQMVRLVHPEDLDYVERAFADFLEIPSKKELEFRLKLEGCPVLWVRVTPLQITFEGRQLLLLSIVEITSEVTNLNTFKKFANKKNSVLNILAHDLMGPLGIANTITQLLGREIKEPQLSQQVETISKITKQAIDMIRDLTTREFLETADVDLVKKRIDVVLKLREYLEECQKSEGFTRRKFYLSTTHDSIFLNVDESKFFQVVNNLISNSLKFTKDDGVLSVSVRDQENSVLFSFADNGIGIPEDLQPKIFQKFTSARRQGLHGEPTVGLGMSIVKTIVEWHQGKIWLTSKETEGTEVFVELPKD